ncbi:hypothetical protein H4R33_001727 [Dimargaris cristalligena]|nr:hypothetical protein H4R33_001727 [Dimargaris cristalligena]
MTSPVDAKEAFLDQWAEFYNPDIDTIAQAEFSQTLGKFVMHRLVHCPDVYLDHAGATVPSQTAIREFSETMCQSLFGNPHSQSRVSLATADRVQAVRTAVLAWLGTTERTYSVIFTANATAALKLAGECFPWQNDGSHFWYHDMAHTSLLGVRELALKAGAHTKCLSTNQVDACLGNPTALSQKMMATSTIDPDDNSDIPTNNPFHLFAYPAQCNYSGARFPLSWSTQIKQRASTKPCRRALQYLPKGPWWVLLDAASYLTTSTLNLNSDENSVDMVALSFYKVFGFPTGLGALIVHNRLAPYFQKSYFGGGTVTAAIASEPWQRYRSQLSDKFEDGTVNYGDIIALQHAMNRWQMLFSPAPRLAFHTAALSIYSLRRMAQELVHPTGQPLCTWYLDPALVQLATQPNLGDPAGLITLWLAHQGPILNFNLRRGDGTWIGYAEVARLATLYRLAIRAGGACNPGAQEHWLQLTPGQIKSNLERGHVCWDDHDLVDNQPTGSVRISFGASSRFEDVDRWIRFLATQFLESSIDLTQSSQNLIAKPTINPATADIRLRGLAICRSFANESSYLLVSENSAAELGRWTVKPCKRCQMICIDQETGQISKEPFSTLSVHRNDQGKVNFGQHLRHVASRSRFPHALQIGASVQFFY